MRKILVLMLVFCMTSLASADLIFTVNGQPQDPSIDPPLYPSDTIELDLHLAAPETLLKYTLTYELDNEQAEFLIDGIVFDWASMFPGKVDDYDQDGIISWVTIVADNFMQPVAGPQDLMHGLIVHCLDDTDVVMTVTVTGATVIDNETVPVGTEMHSLLIPQIIPEPMTIALLGLGGLLLRRRK